MNVGFIGLGTMGGAAAKTMVEAGHTVFGFDIDTDNVKAAEQNGVVTVSAMSDLDAYDVILLSLPGPPEVERVVNGPAGVRESCSKGTVVVDLSTVDPETSKAMASTLRETGIDYLDSPVLGMKAAVGKWILPVGGKRDAYDRAADLLSSIASKTFYVGDSGMGSALKLLNNLMVGVMANGIAEVMALSNIVGLSPSILIEVIGESKAPTNNPMFRTRGERMANEDYSPNFKLDLLAKDVDLGNKMARAHGVHLVTGGTVDIVQKLAQRKGMGPSDFSVLYDYYKRLFSET